MTSSPLTDYVESLQNANTIEEGFAALDKEIIELGFDGILYTYIPEVLITSNFYRPPVYQVSEGFAPEYLEYYTDAELHKVDPMINAVKNGFQSPINWWANTGNYYSDSSTVSKEVVDASRSYGIVNGFTLPLMSDGRGIAGASLISMEKQGFVQLTEKSFRLAELRIKLYHNTVLASSTFSNEFMKPVLNSLSNTQMGYLLGIIEGENTKKIAVDLKTTRAFLDQSMRKMRQRFSGVSELETPSLDKNQLLYYFGAANIADCIKKNRQQKE